MSRPEPAAATANASEISVLHRGAAVAVGLLALAASAIAWGMVPGNLGWMPAWVGVAALYAVGAAALGQARPWARSLMLGVVLCGLGGWVQSTCVLGFTALTMTATGGHGLALALLVCTRCSLSGRHRGSLLFCGAALPCAMMFGLAPMQSVTTTAITTVGAGLLFASAVGLARGRTWGVLAALLAGPVLATGAWLAPELISLTAPHPLLPPNGLLVQLVGVGAVGLAFAAAAPFLAPIVRFVAARTA